MRDSGGHSGNSYAETHIPLLMVGCDCESNREKFYRQIDFASTFSILNGLPIPDQSIGSIIPEMFFNTSQLQILDRLKMVNERLIGMIESDGSEEFKLQLEKAKSYHKMFVNDLNNKNAFLQAEANYLMSSRLISDRLAQRSLDVNIFQVLLGLLLNILISIAILIPSDEMMKELKITTHSFVPFILCGFILKLVIFNEIFEQSNNIKSFLVVMVTSMVLRVVLGIINVKIERFKWFKLFDNDLIYLLIIGHFFFVVSAGSSSFVEEEHQIWYYFCSTMFVFLTFFEFRGRTSAKDFIEVTGKCVFFLLLHVVIRRMNQTGDKWINVPDIGDWLHREVNHSWLDVSIVISLVASAVWLINFHCTNSMLIPFILIGNILLYFHHTRSISNR